MIQNKSNGVVVDFRTICIVMVWLTVLYSAIIQHKFFQIPYGMIILGVSVLLSFMLAHIDQPFDIDALLSEEGLLLLAYMAYMLLIGCLFSPSIGNHISQWITCLEYMFLLIVISSVIKETGTGTFHILLLIEGIVLALVFVLNPVNYGGNRYSISQTMNPNGLGMAFTAGIWEILYQHAKKKTNLIFCALIILLFGYCIILTGSRKAFLSMGVIILLWVLFCYIPSIRENRGNRSIFAIIALIVIGSIFIRVFMNLYSGSEIAIRMNNLLYEATEGNRSNMYRDGFKLFKLNPLFGSGFQSFFYEYGSYSHATLVEIPVSSGIIGSIIYFAVYFVSIRRTVRLYKFTKGIPEYALNNAKIKMILVLWGVMLFYTTCIIHQYQFNSFIIFGIIFGETAYIEQHLPKMVSVPENKKEGYKYIKV